MDVDEFIRDGYVVVRGAFDADAAAECCEAIWAALAEQAPGVDRNDPSTWTQPLIRIDTPTSPAMTRAATAPALSRAYDELIGAGRWIRRADVSGEVPVRFPSEEYPGEIGWRIEGSWRDDDRGDFWAEVRSTGRGLSPSSSSPMSGRATLRPGWCSARTGTRRRCWSGRPHEGRRGCPMATYRPGLRPSVLCRTVAEATGAAGDVYLCHPFIVHTATWPHRGTQPRMMAQPGVEVPDGFQLDGTDGSPVARAIVAGLGDASLLRPEQSAPVAAGRRP
jgi:hypothetical protein